MYNSSVKYQAGFQQYTTNALANVVSINVTDYRVLKYKNSYFATAIRANHMNTNS